MHKLVKTFDLINSVPFGIYGIAPNVEVAHNDKRTCSFFDELCEYLHSFRSFRLCKAEMRNHHFDLLALFNEYHVAENAACFIVCILGFILGIWNGDSFGRKNGIFGKDGVSVIAAVAGSAESNGSAETAFI